MSKRKQLSVSEQFRKRADKVAHLSDCAHYADLAGRHYAKDKITRIEAQMMIDAAVGSPWALFMAWCRHTLRTVTGAKKRMEQAMRAEQLEQRAVADDVAEQMDPAINLNALRDELEAMPEFEESTDEVPDGQEAARRALETMAGAKLIAPGTAAGTQADENTAPSRIVVQGTLAEHAQRAGNIIRATR
jgi:hypothetical protein